MLEHDAAVRTGAGNRRALDANRALLDRKKATDQVEQRRFAAARGPEQGHELAHADLERNVLEREHLAPTRRTIGMRNALDRDLLDRISLGIDHEDVPRNRIRPLLTSKKAALVTGASTGIGRSAVLALARAGYDVAVNYSSSEKAARETATEAHKLGVNTLILKCDVADEAGVRAMFKQVKDKFGRLDVLINNAGTTAAWKPKDLETLSLEEWDRVFAVNVRGLFQVTRAAVPLLKEAKGCVVNTASIVGLRPGPQPPPYAASKAAVVNLTKTLAWNLGPEVRGNAA